MSADIKTKQNTAFVDAFSKVGLEPRDVALNIALAKFQNNGGTFERAFALLKAAYESAGSGQRKNSILDRTTFPGSAEPVDTGLGRGSFSSKEARTLTPKPVSNPPKSRMAGKIRAAKSVMDSFKLRDGRAIGDVPFRELAALQFENAREAYVITRVMNHYSSAPGEALVRDMIKANDLQKFIQKASEVCHERG